MSDSVQGNHVRSKYNRRKYEDKALETRVARVEIAVNHIEDGMVDLRESISQGFRDIKQDLEHQKDVNKPKIVAWAGWAAVILIVIGMFSSGYIRDLERLEATLEQQSRLIIEQSRVYTSIRSEVVGFKKQLELTEKINDERFISLEREIFEEERSNDRN
jgi:hypothetical protein